MIAPLRKPSERRSRRIRHDQLEIARRLVAATLLCGPDADRGPRIAAWKAWLFAAWMVFAALAYGLSMIGARWF
jgi:hypothetical protein